MLAGVHSPIDRMAAWLRHLDVPFGPRAVVPAKALVFYLGMVLLCWVLGREVIAGWRARGPALRAAAGRAVLAFAVLATLCVPFRAPEGLGSLGRDYGAMSVSPFTAGTGWTYRRLLMPALAHGLGLRGGWRYYVLSLTITLVLLTAVALFLGEPRPEKRLRAVGWLVSLGTASFVFACFQNPGYPEALAFVIWLVAALTPLGAAGRFAAVVLCTATHEGSAFFIAPAAMLLFPRRERLHVLGFFAAYVAAFAASYGFSLARASAFHETFAGQSVRDVLAARPDLVLLGVAMGHKLLWLGALAVLVDLLRRRQWKPAAILAATLLAPLAILRVAIDTSRMVGFGFLGLLLAVRAMDGWYEARPRARPWLNALMAANVLVPSYFVAPHAGADVYPGLYLPVAQGIARLVAPSGAPAEDVSEPTRRRPGGRRRRP